MLSHTHRRRMSTCGSLLDTLDERRRWVAQAAEAAEAAKKEAEKSVEDAKKALKSDADVQVRCREGHISSLLLYSMRAHREGFLHHSFLFLPIPGSTINTNTC